MSGIAKYPLDHALDLATEFTTIEIPLPGDAHVHETAIIAATLLADAQDRVHEIASTATIAMRLSAGAPGLVIASATACLLVGAPDLDLGTVRTIMDHHMGAQGMRGPHCHLLIIAGARDRHQKS